MTSLGGSSNSPAPRKSLLGRFLFTWFDSLVHRGTGHAARCDGGGDVGGDGGGDGGGGEAEAGITSDQVSPLAQEYRAETVSEQWQRQEKFLKPKSAGNT